MLQEEVAKCDVFIAMVGSKWLGVTNEEGLRRLDDPDDFVRIEIESALARKVPILVALVDGTPLPTVEQLPESLKELASCKGSPLRPDPFFHDDVSTLLTAIGAEGTTDFTELPTRDRWARATEHAFKRSICGEVAGVVFGVIIAFGFIVYDRTNPDRGRSIAEVLPILVPTLIGAPLVGLRHFGLRGLILGLISSPIFSASVFIVSFLVFSLPTLSFNLWFASHEWIEMERSYAIAIGFFGAMTAVPTMLYVARGQARKRARRVRVYLPWIGLALGLVAGACVGIIVGTAVRRFLFPKAVPWNTMWVGFLLNASLATGGLTVLDGIFGDWFLDKKSTRIPGLSK